MAKAILTTKIRPSYDDLPEQRYHFPRTYLKQIQGAVGDEVIYYEPRRQDKDPAGREGRQCYFATARIVGIREDPAKPNHFYADIDEYIDFDQPVPFREADHYYESLLKKADGSTNKGAFGRAVRNVPTEEFELIRAAGFAALIQDAEVKATTGLAEEGAAFERPMHQHLVSRAFRDAAFSRNIRAAYDSTCALTGFRIVNGGGRAETEAAHIRPVGDNHNGPDSVRNGIALCRTMHWIFDRGLVSLNDDCSVLVAKNHLPAEISRLIHADMVADVPSNDVLRPHPLFLRYHREHIFKG